MTSAPAFSSANPPPTPRKKVTPEPALSSREQARRDGRQKKLEKELAAAGSDVVAPAKEPLAGKIVPKKRGGRERDILDGKAEYKLVPIGDLRQDPENPRKVFRDIDLFARNLEKVGMLQPITVRIDTDGKLTIMYGERRWRAAQVAKWSHVPCIIRYGVQDSSILAQQLAENSFRDDMDPMDEARAVRRFMQDNRISSYADCATAIGHSLTWVANRAMLLNLDEDDQEAVSAKALPILKAVKKAREATGVTRTSKKKIREEAAHFSIEHFLSGRARARCLAAKNAGDIHYPMIGGIACGSCWEVVIRLDARRNADVLAGSTH